MADLLLILAWLGFCIWIGGGVGLLLGIIVVILIGIGSR